MNYKFKYVNLLLIITMFCIILSGCGKKDSKNPEPESGWLFTCMTTDDEPVSGVKIQICSDSTCFMVESDDTGAALFDGDATSYEVHIYKVPDGYVIKEDAPETVTVDDRSISVVFEKE